MKYLKLFLISILVFFVLFTLIGLLFPSNIKAVRAVVVNKHRNIVLTELRIPGKWVSWYPFFSPGLDAHIDSVDSARSIFYNDHKELEVLTKKADSNGISFLIKAGGMEVMDYIMALPVSSDSTQTQVVWSETEYLKWYPWERFRGLLLERTKGIYLDTALNHFKVYVEAIK